MQNDFLSPDLNAEISQKLKIDAEELDKMFTDPVLDRILGCFMGASIGDALGSYCEFEGAQTEVKMDKVMSMPGGGTFPIKSGQVTDDTELAIHCLQALQIYDQSKPLQDQVNPLLSAIALQYIRWLKSHPFDCGITCSTAFNLLAQEVGSDTDINNEQMHQHLGKAFKSIKHANHGSLSNGYLMRIAPIAMMMALIKNKKHGQFEAMIRITKGEINMTHGNELCFESGVQWVNLLSDLALRENQVEGIKEIYQKSIKHQEKNDHLWPWKKAGVQGQLMDATLQSGFAKIAFSYGFNRLKWISQNVKEASQLNSDLYKDTMRMVIQKGGDTDTNAAIVGGLIGSIVGFRNLPQDYVNKQLSLRLTEKGSMYKRSPFYEPFEGFLNAIRLIRKFL